LLKKEFGFQRKQALRKGRYVKHCIKPLMHSNSLCKVNGFDARF
jgi:hypothetical protein